MPTNAMSRCGKRLDVIRFVKAALVKGSFRTITAVPKYVDGMEWVAVNRELYYWLRLRAGD